MELQEQIENSQHNFQIKDKDLSPLKRNINYRKFKICNEIKFEDLNLEKYIAEGSFGLIYRAKWKECPVVVKKLKINSYPSENQIKDFLSECNALEALRHPNIVTFIGACTELPNLCIVLEYCQKGSLWNYLQNLQNQISWEERKKFALDIARAIYYLHSFDPPILHRDIKSLNILLDESLRCKLTDFGWTKTIDNYMSNQIGTYQWMAPEVINSNNYTEKADVFSFGIVLWEICSREPPFKNKKGQDVCTEVLNDNLRPEIPKKTPEAMQSLMRKCWERDPELRPQFKEIIKILDTMNFK